MPDRTRLIALRDAVAAHVGHGALAAAALLILGHDKTGRPVIVLDDGGHAPVAFYRDANGDITPPAASATTRPATASSVDWAQAPQAHTPCRCSGWTDPRLGDLGGDAA